MIKKRSRIEGENNNRIANCIENSQTLIGISFSSLMSRSPSSLDEASNNITHNPIWRKYNSHWHIETENRISKRWLDPTSIQNILSYCCCCIDAFVFNGKTYYINLCVFFPFGFSLESIFIWLPWYVQSH